MKKNTNLIIIKILCILIITMTVGFALFNQELNISGTSNIDSTWKIEITNIESKDVVGNAVNKETPSYNATTAYFNVGLTQPGDSITYNMEITNSGTLDAIVESIIIDKDKVINDLNIEDDNLYKDN